MSLADEIRAGIADAVNPEKIAADAAKKAADPPKISRAQRKQALRKEDRLGDLKTRLNGEELVLRGTSTAKIMLNVRGIDEAVKQLVRLPAEGETLHFVMSGNYHGFDMIPAVHRLSPGGEPITRLVVATLGFSRKNNLQMCKMIDDGMIVGTSVFIVCSEFFAKTDANVYKMAKEDIEARGGCLRITRNHAKIIAIQLAGNHIVTEGSANLRSCVNYEQVTMFNSRELFDFHAGWLSKI